MSLNMWNLNSELDLIANVKKNGALWDCTNIYYYNTAIKKVLFDDIETSMKLKFPELVLLQEGEIKKKFYQLKNYYLQENKKINYNSNGSFELRPSKWYLYDHLSFLPVGTTDRSAVGSTDLNAEGTTERNAEGPTDRKAEGPTDRSGEGPSGTDKNAEETLGATNDIDIELEASDDSVQEAPIASTPRKRKRKADDFVDALLTPVSASMRKMCKKQQLLVLGKFIEILNEYQK